MAFRKGRGKYRGKKSFKKRGQKKQYVRIERGGYHL